MSLKQNQIFPPDFVTQTAEFARACYQLKIPAKWTYEQILNPEVWRNQGDKLKAGDIVTVIGESGDYDADLRVLSSDRGGFVLLRPIREWFAPQAVAIATGEPRTAFAPGIGFVVYDEAGDAVSKHPTQDDATAALKAYLETKEAA